MIRTYSVNVFFQIWYIKQKLNSSELLILVSKAHYKIYYNMLNIQMNRGFPSLSPHARRYDFKMTSNVKKMKTFS